MKKLLCLLLALAVVLIGCVAIEPTLPNGGEEEPLPAPQEEPDEPEQPSGNSTEPAYEAVILGGPAAVTLAFADPNLEALIREILGKLEGGVTNEDVVALVSIVGGGLNITCLTGLQYCVNLRNVLLAENRISDITPLANLPGCTIGSYDGEGKLLFTYTTLSLSLSHNEITDISCLGDYSTVDELTIRLSNNQIVDISALAGLSNLIALSLNRNNISDISPLVGMSRLSQLDLWGNDIGDISAIAGLTALTWLELEQNNVSNITPIANLPNLRRAILSYNQISVVPDLSGMVSLEYLDLRYNQITDDSFLDTLPEGVEVRLEGNPIP